MDISQFRKINLPDTPGIYLFKKNKDILYIGKATLLKDRVKSYFANDLIATRGPLIVDMVFQANNVDYIKTDSVLEALILESNLIKKYQPKYNTKEKDDRSYNYVVFTKDDFPRVLIIRGRELAGKEKKYKFVAGPFINGGQLKEALKIIRKIFPFLDNYTGVKFGYGFYREIGLAPDISSAEAKKDYAKNIRSIKLLFQGKKTNIVKNLGKDMKTYAKNHEFEKADKVKRTIFALNHIQDIALIKDDSLRKLDLAGGGAFRIEAYDVANISGSNTVGVMVVVENNISNKSEYRKFKINESMQNDTAALGEMLRRRLNHPEWRFPDVIVVDGGIAQKNIAEKVLKEFGHEIPVVAVTKDERHRPKMIQGRENLVHKYESEILLANNESHRFAIKYHRARRNVII